MLLTVTHLTRMAPGFVCVAGVDHADGAHVRPVMAQGRLPVELVASRGGPFNMGAVLELGPTQHVGQPPEVEDWQFDWRRVQSRGFAEPDELWETLLAQAQPCLADIFGPELRPHRQSAVVDLGSGRASLGCFLPETPPTLFINQRGRLRMTLTHGDASYTLSVTDLRLCDARYNPDRAAVVAVRRRIDAGVPLVLAVGLTRPYQPRDDEPACHWLQVNNIHLADDPGWRLHDGPATWRDDGLLY